MLGAHPEILGGLEPHLLTPLAHLGYFERVDEAPYDPIITQEAHRELVARFPGGENCYLEACRACADTVYRKLLESSEKSIFLDKTPAYALVLPFIERLYPQARYVVLTRNPLAILSSQAQSFFDGSYEEALRLSPVLDRYVPAIARFLRERPVPLIHVRYEELVQNPTIELEKICQFLGVPFDEGMVAYGERESATSESVTGARGIGDPTGVARHTRPVTESVEKWAREIASDPAKRELSVGVLDGLDPDDLEIWGYPKERILGDLDAAAGSEAPKKPALSRYRLERRMLVRTRRVVQRSSLLKGLLERLRLYADLLLR
jgi:hypothetical protein